MGQKIGNIFTQATFRGRLLTLLIAVSILQVIAAGITYSSLQSQPVKQRFDTQLISALQTMAPILDSHLIAARTLHDDLVSDTDLADAIADGDKQEVQAILDSYTGDIANRVDDVADDVVDTAGNGGFVLSDTKSQQDRASQIAASSKTVGRIVEDIYITDINGEFLYGKEPTLPAIDTVATLQLADEVVGKINVPVVFDQGFFEQVASYTQATVFVSDSDKIVMAKSGEGEANTGVRLLENDSPGELAEDFQELTINGDDWNTFARPLDGQTITVGSAVLTSDIDAVLAANRGKLIVYIALLFLMTVGVSVVIVRSVGAVLRRFVRGTKRVAGGNLDERLPVVGNDEIAILSDSFNTMAGNLQERMDSLVEARRRLKRQVEVFGEALASAHDVNEMLLAVCTIALESTQATHARFWTVEEDGAFVHAACIGLRPTDQQPSELERAVVRDHIEYEFTEVPSWLALPVYLNEEDEVVGILTLVNVQGHMSEDDRQVARRLATQAALALDNARMHKRLKEQATRDGLTGMPNHRSMQDHMQELLDDARSRNGMVSVAMLDVDNFKGVNDTHGHKIGDDALKKVAGVLKSVAQAPLFPARYGGEEFVIVMPDMTTDQAYEVADEARDLLTQQEVPLEDGGVLKLTASFGVAGTDRFGLSTSKEDLVNEADQALYVAKRTGKNKVVRAGDSPQQQWNEGDAPAGAEAA